MHSSLLGVLHINMFTCLFKENMCLDLIPDKKYICTDTNCDHKNAGAAQNLKPALRWATELAPSKEVRKKTIENPQFSRLLREKWYVKSNSLLFLLTIQTFEATVATGKPTH